MRKKLKILVCIIMLTGIVGCGNNKPKEENEKKSMEDFSNFSEYLKSKKYDVYGNEIFEAKELKCDLLEKIDNKDIKGVLSSLETFYIFLNTNSYIMLSRDNNKIYSNNQNCQEINIDTKVEDIKFDDRIGSLYIINENNKLYQTLYDDHGKIFFAEIDEKNLSPTDYLLLRNDIQAIFSQKYSISSTNFFTIDEAIVLKKDGSLYKQEYKENGALKKEELFLSNKEYGNIQKAAINYNSDENKFEIIDFTTDNGFYYNGDVRTDECTKYIDIECEKAIIESEIYKKFNKDIKYIDRYDTILNDNSIIRTEYLTYSLE